MSAAPQPLESPHRLLADFLLADFALCRANTEAICARLEIEDHVVQPAPFVSPPKWHLAHTTWFFDCFLLDNTHANDPARSSSFSVLFNSYYKSLGQHWLQERRGQLSRPTVREIHDYRNAVSESLLRKLERDELSPRQLALLELGMHHEQQHQELLLMDIKYILGTHPQMPAYDDVSSPAIGSRADASPRWLEFAAGLRQIGHAGNGFAFDNESPRHRVWLDAFSLRDQLVRNGEYLAFMRDGGYRRPEFWLSDGWDWINNNHITAPLYWRSANPEHSDSDDWFEYHLGGLHPLDPDLPVSHVSYYEAAAFASWAGARLPSEAELEVATAATVGAAAVEKVARIENPARENAAFWRPGAPVVPHASRACDALENGLLWQWCRNAYEAYPGYARTPDALGEYNGKFMSGRQALRGGCVATPAGHWRPTYRNFYRPEDRWCFTGIRLAADKKDQT
ncbi:MAG: ergothioneine biosynthesis protein EgtB [Pseudomonadota bacterium]|nr:ergothioneine biosynthesis protein EgtB [Pseudomonadota bacterium]